MASSHPASTGQPDEVPRENVVDLRLRQPAAPFARRPWWLRSLASFRLPRLGLGRIALARRLASNRPRRAVFAQQRLRRLTPFASLAIALLIPLLVFSWTRPLWVWTGRLTDAAREALTTLVDAGQSLQDYALDEAVAKFSLARGQFTAALGRLQSLNRLSRSLVEVTPFVRGKLRDGESLLIAGADFAAAGEELSQALAALTQATDGPASFPLAEGLMRQGSRLGASLAHARQALTTLVEVNPHNLPSPYRQQLAAIRPVLPGLKASLDQAAEALPLLTTFFGAGGQREYLFLFQNDAELRPGGGFIGSFALLRFRQGELAILDAPAQGPAAIDDQLPVVVKPPPPILAVAPHWTMHDANWFVDFPTSAEKVAAFYESVRGFPIDGVVALTPAVIERWLAVTGPISLPKYGVVLTQANFLRTTQDQVEVYVDRQAYQPKQFVVDLLPVLLTELGRLPADRLLGLLAALDESLERKDLLFWLKAQNEQQRLVSLGWSGTLPAPVGDQLTLVEANLGGGKTSRVVSRTAHLEVRFFRETTEHTLTLTYRHQGQTADRWTGVPYRGYLKAYLPAGAVLIDAGGFDRLPTTAFFTPSPEAQPDADLLRLESNRLLDEQTGTRRTDEFGRTAFGNWVVLAPGEEQTVSLRYRTANQLTREVSGDLYRLTLTKQPGAQAVPMTIVFPGSAEPLFATLPIQSTPTGPGLTTSLDRDLTLLVLFPR